MLNIYIYKSRSAHTFNWKLKSYYKVQIITTIASQTQSKMLSIPKSRPLILLKIVLFLEIRELSLEIREFISLKPASVDKQ